METIEKCILNLKRNRFNVKFFENSKEFTDYILYNLPRSKSVGFGGSMTLEEIQLYELLVKIGVDVSWHWKSPYPESTKERALDADYYFSSANAITVDGKIVNMDGTGNRVANLFYHHEKVFIVCGVNKIVANEDLAKERIAKIAAPMNTKRLNLNTPCTVSGHCSDCNSQDRICNIYSVINKNTKADIHVFIINENLGF